MTKERRKSQRRPILDSFSFFIVIPKKGVHRLPIHDLSDQGLGFDFDIEGESYADFPLHPEEKLELQFYLNQSLYLPLSIKVARVETRGLIRRVGAEFIEKDSKSFKAFLAFIQMLDCVIEAGVLKNTT